MAFGITAFSQAAIASLGGGIANANGQNINTNVGTVTVDLNTTANITGQPITAAQGKYLCRSYSYSNWNRFNH